MKYIHRTGKMRKNLKRVNDKNSGRIMTKKRRKSNANGKLEQNEKRVISLYFSFFFSEEKKCVCVQCAQCALFAHTMRFNLNINNTNAVRSI